MTYIYCRVKGYKLLVSKLEQNRMRVSGDYTACKRFNMETIEPGLYEKWLPLEVANCIWEEKEFSEKTTMGCTIALMIFQ